MSDRKEKTANDVSTTAVDSQEGTIEPIELEGDDIYIDPVLEKRTLRKFDMYMMPQMMLLQIVSYLDRTNIGMRATNGLRPQD